jgi:hypothetical protein
LSKEKGDLLVSRWIPANSASRNGQASEKDDVKFRRCRCPKWIDGYVAGKRTPPTPGVDSFTSSDAGMADPAYYTLLVADAAYSY